MNFPGEMIDETSTSPTAVVAISAVRQALAAHGYDVGPSGPFDQALKSVIQLFQAQHVDSSGRPLKIDGRVGPNTWSALFDEDSGSSDLAKVLAVAESQLGVRERPPGSNSGPEVDQYLKAAGAAPGNAWCMAFVYWCFWTACRGVNCAVPRSAGVLDVYARTLAGNPGRIVPTAVALADPAKIQPGWVFIQDHGSGHGHTGFVKAIKGGALVTVEGNTNNAASREGVGVFELTRRSVTDDQLLAFIDFSR